MKYILITIFFTSFGFSQKNSDVGLYIKKVKQKIESFENIAIGFIYTLKNTKENINQEMQGQLYLMDDQYKIDIMGVTKFFDGTKLYTIISENEEVIVESNPSPDVDFNLNRLLKFYQDDYIYKWDILQNTPNGKIRYIELIPIKKEKQKYAKMLIGFNDKTLLPYKIIQIGANETQTILRVESIETNSDDIRHVFDFNIQDFESKGYFIINE